MNSPGNPWSESVRKSFVAYESDITSTDEFIAKISSTECFRLAVYMRSREGRHGETSLLTYAVCGLHPGYRDCSKLIHSLSARPHASARPRDRKYFTARLFVHVSFSNILELD